MFLFCVSLNLSYVYVIVQFSCLILSIDDCSEFHFLIEAKTLCTIYPVEKKNLVHLNFVLFIAAPVINATFGEWEDECGYSERIKMITCVTDVISLQPLHQSYCPGVSFYNETDNGHTGVICYGKIKL